MPVPFYPPECYTGNCEYKWQLVSVSPNKIISLSTQMRYRLAEGNGVATYRLGVMDSGEPVGCTDSALLSSLLALQCCALVLNARKVGIMCDITPLLLPSASFSSSTGPRPADDSTSPYNTTAAAVAVNNAAVAAKLATEALVDLATVTVLPALNGHKLAEISLLVRRAPLPQPFALAPTVALAGPSGSGKSTLLSLLANRAGSEGDDGCGRARAAVARHAHELWTGRSSSVGIVSVPITSLLTVSGDDNTGNAINANCSVTDPDIGCGVCERNAGYR